MRSYFWIFLGAPGDGGRHVALDPLCCDEDEHSTTVLSGALLPYPSTTAPAHPPKSIHAIVSLITTITGPSASPLSLNDIHGLKRMQQESKSLLSTVPFPTAAPHHLPSQPSALPPGLSTPAAVCTSSTVLSLYSSTKGICTSLNYLV